MRTGRTSNHDNRKVQHKGPPETKSLEYKRELETNDYAVQRGHEQILDDTHKPPLNKIRPIGPKNPRRAEYLDAAREFIREKE
jgi:hypothetical protein